MISFKQFLLEARIDRYKTILNDIPEKYRSTAEQRIGRALSMLPARDDVVQWYLRFIKFEYLQGEELTPSNKKFVEEFTEKVKKNKFGGDVKYYPKNFISFLQHYLSLPIKKIQDYRFTYEHPAQIIDYFSTLEKEWKENDTKNKEWINITDELEEGGIEPLITFPDGYAWYYLQRHACAREGDAMGHCGNTPSRNYEERLLSFRKIKKEGGQIFTRPSMTFILGPDKKLGEMKGRGNEKPDSKYHKYVLALLELKVDGQYFIKGIVGGGYKPEANFSLADLTEDEQKAILEKRPDLLSKSMEISMNEGIITQEILKKYDKDWEQVTFNGKKVIVDVKKNLMDWLDSGNAPKEINRLYDYIQNDIGTDYYVEDEEVKEFIKDNKEAIKAKGYKFEDPSEDEDEEEYSEEVMDVVRHAYQSAYMGEYYKEGINAIIKQMERESITIDEDFGGDDYVAFVINIIENEDRKMQAIFDLKDFSTFMSEKNVKDVLYYFGFVNDFSGRRGADINEPYVSAKDVLENLE